MAECSGRHITEMQLFHELKQRFPSIPDRLVTLCIKQSCGDKAACLWMLEGEVPGPGRGRQRSAPSTPRGGRREEPTPRSHSTSPPPSAFPLAHSTHRLIQDQLARKRKLEIELEKEKEKLRMMQRQAEELEQDLMARLQAPSHTLKAQQLRKEIASLHVSCISLTKEVDNRSPNGVLLGETDEEFYKYLNTGQRGTLRHNPSRHRERRWAREESGWDCEICTFRNHPQVKDCEGCEMPRIFLDGGESQNIHIHVTHHNFPSCKVVHSWVI